MKKIFFVAFFILSTLSFLKAQYTVDITVCPGQDSNYVEDTIVTFAEEIPQFPEGDSAKTKFLADHIIYPPLAFENNIEARVQVQFVVDKQGKISDVKALTHKSWGFEEEAVRVIKLMPPWIPGRQNGKLINIRFSIPIVFKLKN
jgi:protein TonB